MRKTFVVVAMLALIPGLSRAQDSQSLGDVARQARAQKQQRDAQAKDTASKASTDPKGSPTPGPSSDGKTHFVVTDDDSPNTADRPTVSSKAASAKSDPGAEKSDDRDERAEKWKFQIQSQKETIAALQSEIDEVTNTIHYAGGNCVANCEKWNERQQQKQGQVETMKAQLEDGKKRLEEMQDEARKQGFGSSVYDP